MRERAATRVDGPPPLPISSCSSPSLSAAAAALRSRFARRAPLAYSHRSLAARVRYQLPAAPQSASAVAVAVASAVGITQERARQIPRMPSEEQSAASERSCLDVDACSSTRFKLQCIDNRARFHCIRHARGSSAGHGAAEEPASCSSAPFELESSPMHSLESFRTAAVRAALGERVRHRVDVLARGCMQSHAVHSSPLPSASAHSPALHSRALLLLSGALLLREGLPESRLISGRLRCQREPFQRRTREPAHVEIINKD